jgi:hypothetical protein
VKALSPGSDLAGWTVSVLIVFVLDINHMIILPD